MPGELAMKIDTIVSYSLLQREKNTMKFTP